VNQQAIEAELQNKERIIQELREELQQRQLLLKGLQQELQEKERVIQELRTRACI